MDTPTEVGPTGSNIRHRWALLLCLKKVNVCPQYGVTQFLYLRRHGQNDSKRDVLWSEYSGILASTVHRTLNIASPYIPSLEVKNLS